jgi:lantibiotic transport system permease protein
MSLVISTSAEILKTRRSASFWLSIIGAALIPSIFFLAYFLKPGGAIKQLQAAPWETHFLYGWQALSSFLFPMYVILICTLIPQIEFKNNTWKQVFASPQSYGNIFFSKFITIHFMILFFYLLFNFFMISAGVVVNLLNPDFSFLEKSIDWQNLVKLNVKTYISILGISAIQYALALRFKNFISPMGVGLALLVGALIAIGFGWEHMYKVPFAHPSLKLRSIMFKDRPFLENHELNSIGYFIAFLIIGFLDMRFKKEKG